MALLLASCDALPRDPNDTLETVRQEGRFRVGMILSANAPGSGLDRALVKAIEAGTGARAAVKSGAAEPMLAALMAGSLDLVVGPFVHPSPWETRVTFGPPLAQNGDGDGKVELRAAMANGENRWIMLVESASRSVVAKGVEKR